MKSWPRSLRSAVNPFACLAVGVVLCPSSVALAPGSAPSVLYTASDFPALAGGVDAGLAGEVDVQVWAPSQDEWSLTKADDAIALKLQGRPGDRTPRWKSLGKVNLAKGRPLKIAIAKDSAEVKIETKPQGKSAPTDRADDPPGPRFLWLTASTDPGAVPDLDFVRGRIEAIEPPPDRRRTEIRTNKEGADFQPPRLPRPGATARAVREQLLVTMGLWPMPPRPRSTPRSTASSTATATRSRRSSSRRSPASP